MLSCGSCTPTGRITEGLSTVNPSRGSGGLGFLDRRVLIACLGRCELLLAAENSLFLGIGNLGRKLLE